MRGVRCYMDMLISSIGCVGTLIAMTSRENAISHLLAISKG